MPIVTKNPLLDSPLLGQVLEAINELQPVEFLSRDASVAMFAIGKGMRLREPFRHGEFCSLVHHPSINPHLKGEVIVSVEVVDELLGRGLLYEMREADEYTEEMVGGVKYKSGRGGWRSAGLDGTKAKFYCAVI